MILQRYLDDIEVQLRTVSTHTVEYEGTVDEAALVGAYEQLCVRYPVLRARIRADDRGWLLQVAPDDRPALMVLDGDESSLTHVASQPWEPGHAVAQLVVVRGKSRGFVALRADHAVVDGRSRTSMFGELWRFYTDLVNGCDVSVEPGAGLPSSPATVIKQGHGAAHRGRPGYSKDSDARRCVHIPRRIHLTHEETARLISVARSQQTSVHALVCGAILVNLRSHGTTPEPARMVCLSIVDLRSQLNQAVRAIETTNPLGVHMAEVVVPAGGDPVAVGHEVKTQLDTDLRRGNVPMLIPSVTKSLYSSRVVGYLEQYLAKISVTNIGVIPRFDQPAGLTIKDWRRVTTGGKGPNFTMYGVWTYDGRLSILCGYPSDSLTSDDADRLTEGVKAQLFSVGS